MRASLAVLLLSVTLSASQSVVPIELLYSDAFFSCRGHVTSEYDETRCIKKETARADKKLNIAYRKAQNRMQIFRHNDLQNIQRIWIKYRDAKCEFLYHKESGTAGLSSAAMCKLQETILRTIELDETY